LACQKTPVQKPKNAVGKEKKRLGPICTASNRPEFTNTNVGARNF
jgi:hypothetical protein